jgi:voltage-gated potassium channel
MIPKQDLPHLGPLRLPEDSPVPALLRRVGLAVALILIVAVILWWDRDGLRDNVHPDRPISFIDVFYFTVVSLTTVGYGDIVPATDGARLINAVLLTPIRIFLWALFLGTAYELTLLRLRFREDRQMKELHDRLRDHVIVCGYGVKGRAIVDELIAHGQLRDQIVAIDTDENAIAAAVREGLVALRGDASQESLLRAAAVEKATAVMAAPNRDDACVLLCLTVRSLAPKVQLVAAAREEENVKLLYGAGADLVVTPSVSGGRLMAAAVRQRAVPHVLEDILAFGHGLAMSERVVLPEEAGLLARELPDMGDTLILGVLRDREHFSFQRLETLALAPGDIVVYLADETPEASHRTLVRG